MHLFAFFYFLNYESMITQLQETWKIQNKVKYSSTVGSVQSLSHVWSLQPHSLQHARPPVHRQLLGFTQTMSIESVMPSIHIVLCHPFSSHPQSFPASDSFPMSQFFTSGGQIIGVSASASVLLMNIQDWFPLGWTDWIFMLSKGLARVFSNIIVQKHKFFGAQLSL